MTRTISAVSFGAEPLVRGGGGGQGRGVHRTQRTLAYARDHTTSGLAFCIFLGVWAGGGSVKTGRPAGQIRKELEL